MARVECSPDRSKHITGRRYSAQIDNDYHVLNSTAGVAADEEDMWLTC
jgi:hypothetical protein